MVAVIVIAVRLLPEHIDEREDAERYEKTTGCDEIGLHALLDEIEIDVGQRDPQYGPTDKDQNDCLHIASHLNNTDPTMTLTSTATTKVAGENRHANLRPKNPVCREMSLMSTMGPTTRKAKRAVSEN